MCHVHEHQGLSRVNRPAARLTEWASMVLFSLFLSVSLNSNCAGRRQVLKSEHHEVILQMCLSLKNDFWIIEKLSTYLRKLLNWRNWHLIATLSHNLEIYDTSKCSLWLWVYMLCWYVFLSQSSLIHLELLSIGWMYHFGTCSLYKQCLCFRIETHLHHAC